MTTDEKNEILTILMRAVTVGAAEYMDMPEGSYAMQAVDEAWDRFGLTYEADLCVALSAQPDNALVQRAIGLVREAMMAGAAEAIGQPKNAILLHVSESAWAKVRDGYAARLAAA